MKKLIMLLLVVFMPLVNANEELGTKDKAKFEAYCSQLAKMGEFGAGLDSGHEERALQVIGKTEVAFHKGTIKGIYNVVLYRGNTRDENKILLTKMYVDMCSSLIILAE